MTRNLSGSKAEARTVITVPGLSPALKMAVTSLFLYQGLSFPFYKMGLSSLFLPLSPRISQDGWILEDYRITAKVSSLFISMTRMLG